MGKAWYPHNPREQNSNELFQDTGDNGWNCAFGAELWSFYPTLTLSYSEIVVLVKLRIQHVIDYENNVWRMFSSENLNICAHAHSVTRKERARERERKTGVKHPCRKPPTAGIQREYENNIDAEPVPNNGRVLIQSWCWDHSKLSRKFWVSLRMIFSAPDTQTIVLVSTAEVWISALHT